MFSQTECATLSFRNVSLQERLTDRKKDLEERLNAINAALSQLAANPAVAETLEAVQKACNI